MAVTGFLYNKGIIKSCAVLKLLSEKEAVNPVEGRAKGGGMGIRLEWKLLIMIIVYVLAAL